MRRTLTVMLALAVLPATAEGRSNPYALESDARPRVAGGRIVTDAISDATGLLSSDVRSFGWRFQTIPGDPYFIQEPGFNAVSGSGLPAGSVLGFNVARGLAYWGAAPGSPVDFAANPVPSGGRIDLNFGAGTVTISGATGPQPGFGFASISSSGAPHRHLNGYLSTDGAAAPAAGVYLTAIRLTNTAGPLDSDPLMLLFGNGIDTDDMQRALSYVANPLSGDANYSGRTDIADFAILASNFNAPGQRAWFDGDFNADRTVGIGDFSLLAATFNLPAPPAGRTPVVPEPAAVAALVPIVALLRRR